MNANAINLRTVRVFGYLGRALGALVLLAIASFTVFGFLESFEPGISPLWQAGYAAAGSAFLVGSFRLLLRQKTAGLLGGVALLAAAMFCALGFMTSCRARGLSWQLAYVATGCVCLLGAAAMLRSKAAARGTAVRFLFCALFFGLFGMFSCKFAVGCLIPWVLSLEG